MPRAEPSVALHYSYRTVHVHVVHVHVGSYMYYRSVVSSVEDIGPLSDATFCNRSDDFCSVVSGFTSDIDGG